jgi:transmembrane sensor
MTSPANVASDRAAVWILRQEEPGWSAGDQAALEQWLEETPLNRAAYLRQFTGWRAADRIGSLGNVSIAERFVRHRAGDRRWWRWSVAASLVLMVCGGSVFLPSDTPSHSTGQSFETAVGMRRKVELADRSRVELNTATRVRAAVSASQREIWLDRGEAFFDVSHRAGTPFVVHAGTRTITVLGTKFSVRRDDDNIVVSVLEGRVRVDDTRDLRELRSTTISSGDMAFVRDTATLVSVHANTRLENALVWRNGMVNFDNARLADAVKEFNRYHHRQIVIEGNSIADMRIDGAFQSANVNAFLHLLRDAYGLKLTERAKTIEISN